MGKISSIYYNIKHGTQNLIKWFPVVWQDRDWDHHYLTKVLSFKLSNMEKLFRNEGHTVNSDEIANQLKCVAQLAKAISDEDYESEAFKGKEYLLEKHEIKFEGNKLVTYGLTDAEKKEFRELVKLEDKYMDRDIELLFDLMKKNIRTWWD